MGRMDGKVAFITGGAQGIGKAAAVIIAREGGKVAIGDINDEIGLETVAEITKTGGEAIFVHTDVSSTPDMERLVNAAVKQFGKLNVAVNNAAVALNGTVVDISEERWNQVLNTNLTSVWRGMKLAIPHMQRAGGGSIVNVSSVQSLMGFPDWSAYAAAKGGINALTQQAAVEYALDKIRVNAIAPGTIMTPMNERIFRETADPEALIQSWNQLHALGRFGEPNEVGELILFLASDESSFITGEVIRVDGGATINGR